MSRALSMIAAAALALAAAPVSAQTLTRIETKPFYGAVVTIEEGVRVFRPLPATGHVIINPDGRTPLNVSINEVREVPAGGGYPVTGGGYEGNGYGGYGLYLNPWAGFGKHGHHSKGHHGKGPRYVTHVQGKSFLAPGPKIGKPGSYGKAGSFGGKAGGGHH